MLTGDRIPSLSHSHAISSFAFISEQQKLGIEVLIG